MSDTEFFRKDIVRILGVPMVIVFWYIFVPLFVAAMLCIGDE